MSKKSGSFKFRQLPNPPKPDYNQCRLVKEAERYDCFPDEGANVEGCEARGCCWIPAKIKPKNLDISLNVPYCFYPPNYNTYNFINVTETGFGLVAFLKRIYRTAYPDDVEILKMIIKYETETRLHIKVSAFFIQINYIKRYKQKQEGYITYIEKYVLVVGSAG